MFRGTSNRNWFGSTLTKKPDTYVQLSFFFEFVATQIQQRPQNAVHNNSSTNQVTGLEPSKVCLRRVLPEEVFTHEVQLIYSHVLVLRLASSAWDKSIAFWIPIKTPATNPLRNKIIG